MTIYSRAIQSWLSHMFPAYANNFMVRSDTEIFKKKEDKGIWEQAKGQIPENVDIYLKITPDQYEYVCDISSDEDKLKAETKVLNGLNQIKLDLERINKG